MADAVRDRLIVVNPAAGIALPRPSRKRPVYLTHEQVAALAAASGDYEGLVLFLAYTGLRWGEGVGLRVRDLDLLRKRATIAENAVQSGRRIFVGTRRLTNSAPCRFRRFCCRIWPVSANGRTETTCCGPATTAST
uniref:hypothetical protein n=1 Tax=Mycobacterium mantenii TaxID=560555 RepID=UPI002F96691C